MPFSQQLARDNEDNRCVSPQRLVPASSASRVLPFVPSVTMSPEDRLRELRAIDPETAAMIDRIIDTMHARRCHAS